MNLERSVITQFQINVNKAICSFGHNNSIIIVFNEGKYYQCVFNTETGETTLLHDNDILKDNDSNQFVKSENVFDW